jgi:hypothetical protein
VKFSVNQKAELIVAVYEEGMLKMLGSGKTSVNAGDTSTTVEIVIDDMPKSFVAGAYLLDADTHKPLCDNYTTNIYTKEIQDIQTATVDDFADELVVNLDNDTTTNFAVFSEDTAQAAAGGQVNQVIAQGNGTYTISNADNTFTSLKAGDTFSYDYGNGELLLVKVASVSVTGTTVTVREDENADLTDFFDYVKIEADGDSSNAVVDNSNLESGVTYLGRMTEAEADQMLEENASETTGNGSDGNEIEEQASQTVEVNGSGNGSVGSSLAYEMDKTIDENVKLKGKISSGFTVSCSYYLSLEYQEISLSLDYSASVSVNVSGKSNLWAIPLGKIETPILPCVNVGFTPVFVGEVSAKIEWTGKITWKIGFSYDSINGLKNQSQAPTTSGEVKFEGTLFVGVKATPYAAIIDSHFCKASIEMTAGIEETSTPQMTDVSKESKHLCNLCYAGEIKAKLTASVSLEIINDWGKVNEELVNIKKKISDFYRCVDKGEFAYTTCPHKAYQTTIKTTSLSMSSLEDIQIRIVAEDGTNYEGTTDEDGQCVIYLPNGTYQFTAEKDAYSGTNEATVSGAAQVVQIDMSSSATDHPLEGETEKGNESELVEGETEDESESATVVDSGTCGDNLTWTLDRNGQLTISGTGDMNDCSYSNVAPWYSYHTEIKTIVIKKGLTGVGDLAFWGCSSLTSISLPESLTSIGDDAFACCSSLTSISLPESLTSIGSSAFDGCGSLTSISLPEGLTSIGDYAFAECWCLTSISLPESLMSIGEGAFFECNLTSISLPENLTSIGHGVFFDCHSLTSASLPESLMSTGDATFYRCWSLISISLPESLTSIGDGAFDECSSLTSISLPESLTSIGDEAFNGCSSLTDISLPKSLTIIGKDAFGGCSGLTSISLPESLTSIGDDAFWGCSGLTNILFKGNRPDMESSVFYGVTATAYYPRNDSSWDGIDYQGDGTITWVPYDPSTQISLASVLELASDTVGLSSDMEESDDENMEEQCVDLSEALSSDNFYTQESISEESEIELYQMSDVEDTNNSDDVIIIEESSLEVYSTAENTAETNTAVYKDLTPNTAYVFAVVKSESASDLLSSANLLYLAQGNADSSGNLSFSYIPRETYAGAKTAIYGGNVQEEPPSKDNQNSNSEEEQPSKDNQNSNNEEEQPSKDNQNSDSQEEVKKDQDSDKKEQPETVDGMKNEELDGSHTYGTPTFIWLGLTSCKAEFACTDTDCDETKSIICNVENRVDSFTCTGGTIYTAWVIFEDQKYTDEKTVVAEHAMGEWTITEAVTVLHPETQQRVCKVCGGATEKRTVGSRLTPTIALTATNFPMKMNQSTSKLKVTGLAEGDSIKSVTSNQKKIVKVVSVNANGTIKLKAQKKTGTAKLTITLASGLQKTVTVKVQKTAVKTTKISGLSKTLVLKKAKKATLKPVVTPITSQDKLTYQTSNKKVATVSKSGVITAKKAGKAKITVKAGKKKFTVTVTVK